MFNKIVVGIDGSESSINALRLACDLAGKYDSEIHLVHTPHPQTVAFALGAAPGYHVATTMPSEKEVEVACQKILDKGVAIVSEYDRTITQTYTERGDAADHITACAQNCGADLIVTGRRGLGSVSSLLLGSTSQSVNHQAKCACLSVV